MIRCRLYAGEDGRVLVLGYGKTKAVAKKKAMAHARKRKVVLPADPLMEFDEARGKK